MTSWLCRGLVGRKRLPNFKKHDDLMCLSLDLSFPCFDVHGPMVYCLLILFQAGQDAEAASGEENSQGTFEKRHGPRPSRPLPNLCRIFALQKESNIHGSPMDLPWISQYFKLEIRGIVDRSTCESSRCHRTWCQKTSQEPLPCKALNLHTVDCILRFQVQSGFDML